MTVQRFFVVFSRIFELCAQTRKCKIPIKTYGFPRFFVVRVFFEQGSAVEGNSTKKALKIVSKSHLEASLESQMESKLRLEGPNGVQVALGGQFGRPNGLQVDLGGQFARARWCLTAPKWSPSGAWRAVVPEFGAF